MYLFLCINSVLLFKRLFWLVRAIMYFSVRQRSYLLVPHLYGVAYAAVLHFRLNSILSRFNCQICFESSVLFSKSWFRNEFVWLLYRYLNSPSDAHNIHMFHFTWLHQLCKQCTFSSNCQQVDNSGADPGLILGCCKILQKKLKIEMI